MLLLLSMEYHRMSLDKKVLKLLGNGRCFAARNAGVSRFVSVKNTLK